MSQTKYKMPVHIKQAVVWMCRGYYDALYWLRSSQPKLDINGDEKKYNYNLVRAVDSAIYCIGDDIDNIDLRQHLRRAIWDSTLNGREYPYEIWDLPTICRDDFYERKRKFIKTVAENMGLL